MTERVAAMLALGAVLLAGCTSEAEREVERASLMAEALGKTQACKDAVRKAMPGTTDVSEPASVEDKASGRGAGWTISGRVEHAYGPSKYTCKVSHGEEPHVEVFTGPLD